MRKRVLTLLILPGSPTAIQAGCTCLPYLNNYGCGTTLFAGGEVTFWLEIECPIHGAMARNALSEMQKGPAAP